MKEEISKEISVLSERIGYRIEEIKNLQDKIEEYSKMNKFDESVLKLRKEQISKLK